MDINDAADIFAKGKEFADAVARQAMEFASTASLKAQIFDKSLEYDKLMQKLGCAVYETLRHDPDIVAEHQDLFDAISATIDAKQQLEDQLSEVQAQTDATRPIDVEPNEPDTSGQWYAAAEPTGTEQADEAVVEQADEKKAYGYRNATAGGADGE